MKRSSRVVKRLLLVVVLFVASAWPARADSFTIDSTNCSAPDACFGLSWMLTVNSGSFLFGGGAFGFEAVLEVTDDPFLLGMPSVVISAVDFKVSSSVMNAVLYTAPTTTVLGAWTTSASVLSSGGCVGPNAGFVCSDSSSDPANFVASTTPQTWGWYFNTAAPIFPSLAGGHTSLAGGHIGAKMTDLSRPGRLLSETNSVSIPEGCAPSLVEKRFGATLLMTG